MDWFLYDIGLRHERVKLMKLITFTCSDLSPKKLHEATKEKDMISNWSHLSLRRHNFVFYLSNTVAAVDLFVVVVAAAVVVPVVVALGKDIQE